MKLTRRYFLVTLAAVAALTLTPRPASAAEPAGKTVRLLTIGNSFSQNATHYLKDIAAADGQTLIHTPIVVGGAPLKLHWDKAEAYEADPKDPKGVYASGKSLRDYLTAQPWDFVTIQQASIQSHNIETYRPYAQKLRDYIKTHAPKATILLHETWEYRVDDPRFKGSTVPAESGAVKEPLATGTNVPEPKTQAEMYRMLHGAYYAIAQELGLQLIPVGDAFHLVNTDPKWAFRPDDSFNPKTAKEPELPNQTHSLNVGWKWVKPTAPAAKPSDPKPAATPDPNAKLVLKMDGHHANTAGEYLGACVWYEVLFKRTCVGNSYLPPGLDPDFAKYLQTIAHQCAHPATY